MTVIAKRFDAYWWWRWASHCFFFFTMHSYSSYHLGVWGPMALTGGLLQTSDRGQWSADSTGLKMPRRRWFVNNHFSIVAVVLLFFLLFLFLKEKRRKTKKRTKEEEPENGNGSLPETPKELGKKSQTAAFESVRVQIVLLSCSGFFSTTSSWIMTRKSGEIL